MSVIKDGKFMREDNATEPNAKVNLSNEAKPKEIITSERVVFVPKFECFVVMGPTGKYSQ